MSCNVWVCGSSNFKFPMTHIFCYTFNRGTAGTFHKFVIFVTSVGHLGNLSDLCGAKISVNVPSCFLVVNSQPQW